MEQFAASINEFLSFRRYDILPDKGKISARQAKQKAEAEYDLFNPTQKIVSDFDRAVKNLKTEAVYKLCTLLNKINAAASPMQQLRKEENGRI